MPTLRQLLGMKPAKRYYTDHEKMARRLVRQLTVLGFSPYDVWEITVEMEQLSLNATGHPDLFPPNQKPVIFSPEQEPLS